MSEEVEIENQVILDEPIDMVDEYVSDDNKEQQHEKELDLENQIKEHVNTNDQTEQQQQQEEEEDDEEDDFDDFNEAESQAAEHNKEEEEVEEEDDDDFGDFDDVEYTQQSEQYQQPEHHEPSLPSSIFSNPLEFSNKLDLKLNEIFPTTTTTSKETTTDNINTTILNERSDIIYKQISNMPYLQPTNWIKSNIRHNLLIKLGIPINLDELNTTTTTSITNTNTNSTGIVPISNIENTTRRRSSISVNDIKWNLFNIPKFEELNIDNDLKLSMIQNTNEILTKIELENLQHNSEQFLRDSSNSEIIDDKLNQLMNNYQELIKLSSIWINQIDELKNDFETYENVVQSFIGYSQKLRRDEIFENLKKLKHTKKKKKLWN